MGWRRALAAITVAGLALLASGCDGDGGEDPSTPSDPGTAVISDDPSSEDPSDEPSTEEPTATGPTGERPEAEPPDAPPIMQAESVDGAAAFVWYYLEYWNYMSVSGDTAWFEAHSADECEWCHDQVEEIDSIHAGGGWIESEGLIFDITTATVYLPTEERPVYTVAVDAEEAPSTFVYGDGSTDTASGGAFEPLAVALEYGAGGFIVVAVGG